MAKVTWKKDYTPFVAGGIVLTAILGLWYLIKPELPPPPPPPEVGFKNFVMVYARKGGVMTYRPNPTSLPGLEWDREKSARLMSPQRSRGAVYSPEYPINVYVGDIIRAQFAFDYKGPGGVYRFTVWITHAVYADYLIIDETYTIYPSPGEYIHQVLTLEGVIPPGTTGWDGAHWNARGRIRVDGIAAEHEEADVFSIWPALPEFTNFSMIYARA